MVEISIFRARNTTGLAINDKRITNTKPYGLIQTIQKFQVDEKEIINAIENVKEVKHGQWEEIEDYDGDVHYRCTNCKTEFYLEAGTPDDNEYFYCPHCGAIMMKDGDTKCQ